MEIIMTIKLFNLYVGITKYKTGSKLVEVRTSKGYFSVVTPVGILWFSDCPF
jgi:hypothetical protein